MDTTALMTIDLQDGTRAIGTSRFWSGSSDPLFLLPALADYYTWVSEQHMPLSVATYRDFAAAHAGLPADDLPGNELTPAASRPGYRYHLTLAANGPGLRLRIDAHNQTAPAQVFTHANLYAAAAVCCEHVAARARHFADTHHDFLLPGGDPDTWSIRAARYRVAQHSPAIRAAAANLGAQFLPSTFDCAYPAIQVGGVLVFAYLDPDGVLRVSVDAHFSPLQPGVFIGQCERCHVCGYDCPGPHCGQFQTVPVVHTGKSGFLVCRDHLDDDTPVHFHTGAALTSLA